MAQQLLDLEHQAPAEDTLKHRVWRQTEVGAIDLDFAGGNPFISHNIYYVKLYI